MCILIIHLPVKILRMYSVQKPILPHPRGPYTQGNKTYLNMTNTTVLFFIVLIPYA